MFLGHLVLAYMDLSVVVVQVVEDLCDLDGHVVVRPCVVVVVHPYVVVVVHEVHGDP